MSELSLELIIKTAADFGFTLSSGAATPIKHYVEQLCFWGQRINLTSRPEPYNLLERHLPDAFKLASALQTHSIFSTALQTDSSPSPPLSSLTCVDFGSGAGLPGIPLALCLPMIKLTLVEPNHKKCSFLRTICHELKSDMDIRAKKMEQTQIPPQDIVCSRATWSPSEWLKRAVSWAKPGGVVVLFIAHLEELPLAPPELEQTQQLTYQLIDGSPRSIILYSRSF